MSVLRTNHFFENPKELIFCRAGDRFVFTSHESPSLCYYYSKYSLLADVLVDNLVVKGYYNLDSIRVRGYRISARARPSPHYVDSGNPLYHPTRRLSYTLVCTVLVRFREGPTFTLGRTRAIHISNLTSVSCLLSCQLPFPNIALAVKLICNLSNIVQRKFLFSGTARITNWDWIPFSDNLTTFFRQPYCRDFISISPAPIHRVGKPKGFKSWVIVVEGFFREQARHYLSNFNFGLISGKKTSDNIGRLLFANPIYSLVLHYATHIKGHFIKSQGVLGVRL